jgi:hypothetical protein
MDTATVMLGVVAILLNTIMLYQVISQIPTWKRAAVIMWLNSVVLAVKLLILVA